MAEEQNPKADASHRYGAGKNLSNKELAKKAQQATLNMAKDWGASQNTIHHAIKSYEDVIRVDFESSEADEARGALLKIAEDWDKKGRKYAAAKLYKKLMVGR